MKMRDIKFRYVYQNIETGAFFCEYLTLENIEQSNENFKYRKQYFALVSRDEWTGLTGKDGVDVYENDLVKVLEHYEGDILIKEHIGQVIYKEGDWWVENPTESGFGVSVWEYCYNHCGGVMGNMNKEIK
jgi:hypothetical protein